MITYLIYKLIRKYLKANALQAIRIRHIFQTAFKLLLPLLLCLLLLKAVGQKSTLEYEVIRNNKVIGHTIVIGLKEPGKVTYQINAEIKVSIIKDFRAISNEEKKYKISWINAQKKYNFMLGTQRKFLKGMQIKKIYRINYSKEFFWL